MDSTTTPTAPARDTLAFLLFMASVVALPLSFALMGRLAHADAPPPVDVPVVAEVG